MEAVDPSAKPKDAIFPRGGLALDPRDPAFFQNPYPAYAAMHRAGAVFRWPEIGCLAACGHALVWSLLRDRRFGRILPGGADGRSAEGKIPDHLRHFQDVERHSLLDLEPPTHTRIRGLVLKAFVSRQVERLAPRIERQANDLIDRFAMRGSVELVEEFATPLPVSVIAHLIGVGVVDARLLLDWSHRMVAMYQFGRTDAVERSADEAASQFRAFVVDAIATKRRRPGDDLVSALIQAETERGSLDEDEMISTVILLMNAGHEATVHQIGNGVKAILESEAGDPARLFADEATAASTVEEVLRFDTPLHLFKRIALEDIALSEDIRLRRGEEIALLLAAANRDPLAYTDPDGFDPTRRGPPHASFGAGIHFCVGAPLARLELRIAFTTLFHRLKDLSLTSTPAYRDSWHFRGLERLDLAFRPDRHLRS